MSIRSRLRGRTAIVIVAGIGLLIAACGSNGTNNADDQGAQVTLRVNLFGRFGYADLYKAYMQKHQNIKIVETAEGDLGHYNQQLTQRLAAGSGAGDVVALEEGIITQFKDKPQLFVNLLDYGAADLKDNWLPWKYEGATAENGNYLLGLGTDVGGLAMCYRRDLFAKAGLPTDRDQVSALWPTWDDYIKVGKQFQSGIGNSKIKFIDSATNTYNAILMQNAEETYFDQNNELIIETNPAVKAAWDKSLEIAQAGLSARLRSFSNEWNAGFANGSFATIACPAWMTGYIEGQAGTAGKGNWDIAAVPGGSGNWGGSWLAVPASSKHKAEAAELIKYLTSPEGQLSAFEREGNLPSSPELYNDPTLLAKKNEYFNNAPVGQIFVKGAANLKPVFLGAKNQPVRDAVENAMRAVEQGQISAQEGWKQAVAGAKQAAR